MSALEQELPTGSIEVIVVNDSGRALDAAISLTDDPRVMVVDTNRRRQSVARNTGAAIARGHYLMFLDDDDWLADGGIAVLVSLFESAPSAVVAYGAGLLVDGKGDVLGRLDLNCTGNCAAQTLAGGSIQVGGALIETRTFFAAGGFYTLLPNGDEVMLFRRIALLGDFVHTGEVVVRILRGSGWQSSVERDYPALDSVRISRELMLNHPGVFGSLVRSADTPYWRARIVKAYAASAYWNITHRQPLRALSRVVYLLYASINAVPILTQRTFWRGIADKQVRGTFQRALEEGALAAKTDQY